MSRWHSRFGVALGLWAALVLVAIPAACAEWSGVARYSSSSGLGFDEGQIGVELSATQGPLSADLVATTAEKIDGGEGYGVRLVAERKFAGNWSAGARGSHIDVAKYEKTGFSPTLTYAKQLDEWLSVRARLYGPNTAAPHEWGAASRLTARFGQFISAIEVEGWRFDGGSGRRASILAGYAW